MPQVDSIHCGQSDYLQIGAWEHGLSTHYCLTVTAGVKPLVYAAEVMATIESGSHDGFAIE